MARLSQRVRFWTAILLDAIVPPRRSDRTVRDMSPADVAYLTRFADSSRRGAPRILLPYRHPHAKALIKEFKYRRNPRAIALAAALIAEECVGIASEQLSPPILLGVPMHETRRRERGFNQTHELCAHALSLAASSVAYQPTALVRTRQTAPQQTLPRRARLTNVQNSMRADPALVCDRVCIVIDDVTTTGATFAEARRALEKAGASAVHCVALAG